MPLLPFFFLLLDTVAPEAVASDTGTPVDQLLTAAAATAPPADVLFVLDTAQNFNSLAQSLRADIARVAMSLPDGDRVAVLSYHTRASFVMPWVVLDATNRDTVKAQIEALTFSNAKDFDLGAGLAATVEQLTRAEAAPYSFVVVVGDFCHNPAIASTYDAGGQGCRPIKGLSTVVSSFRNNYHGTRLTSWYLPVKLPGSTVDKNGLEAFQQVLGVGTVVDTVATAPQAWLASFVTRLRTERYTPYLQHLAESTQLELTVLQGPTEDAPTARIEVKAPAGPLSVQLRSMQIEGAQATLPEALDLNPTATMDVSFVLPEPPFSLLPASDVLDLPLKLTADVALGPEPVLSTLGISAARKGLSAQSSLQISRSYGQPLWVSVLSGLGLMTLITGGALWFRVRLLPSKLGGQFTWRTEGSERRTLDIANREEVPIVISGERLEVGTRENAVLILRMQRTLRGSRAEVEIRRARVEINSKEVPPGRYPVFPGGTSFQFNGFFLTWE